MPTLCNFRKQQHHCVFWVLALYWLDTIISSWTFLLLQSPKFWWHKKNKSNYMWPSGCTDWSVNTVGHLKVAANAVKGCSVPRCHCQYLLTVWSIQNMPPSPSKKFVFQTKCHLHQFVHPRALDLGLACDLLQLAFVPTNVIIVKQRFCNNILQPVLIKSSSAHRLARTFKNRFKHEGVMVQSWWNVLVPWPLTCGTYHTFSHHDKHL